MKGLFQICSDDCTYYYKDLIVVIPDEALTTMRFQEKFLEMYPSTSDIDFYKLVIDNEDIVVTNDCSDTYPVCIETVDFFE